MYLYSNYAYAKLRYGYFVKVRSVHELWRRWKNEHEFWNILCGSRKLTVTNSP